MREKKTAVVYVTKNGSTKRYAEWVARSCNADLFVLDEAVIDDLAGYDTLIYGAPVYAGNIAGIPFIKGNRDLLKNVQLVVFAVGLTQPGDDAAFEEVIKRNFTGEEQEGIRFFHFPGALDHKKMNFMQKGMMRVLKRAIMKKPKETRTQMEEYILESFGGKVDFTNFAYIKPLVDYVRYDSEGEKNA